MSELDNNTYYGKISKLGRVFNKLDPNQVREAIVAAQTNYNKDVRDISNVHFEDTEIPRVELNNKPKIEISNDEEER